MNGLAGRRRRRMAAATAPVGADRAGEAPGSGRGVSRLERAAHIERLRRDQFDILVIGGGATGCGAALDAATRGLSVALVERADFSEGTSSRSTKLIHGGIRYLERAVKRFDRTQFRLVREALRERAVLMRIAPHLSREVPIFVPLYRHLQTPYYLLGLKLYDRLAGRHAISASRFVRRRAARERFPQLRVQVDRELTGRRLRGGVIYYDGQFDDSRMNVALALTVAREGAAVANYVAVVALAHGADGRVIGAQVEDRLTGDRWRVSARVVVNAGGPYADRVRQLETPQAEPLLRVSTGTHIVLGPRFPPPPFGFLIPRTEDRRVMFMLPWQGHTLVGTTDVPAEVHDDPVPSAAEIDYLVAHTRRYLNLDVAADDVRAAWCGLRPLLMHERDAARSRSAAAARDHRIEVSATGLVTAAGGKWTTYRSLAVAAINRAIAVAGLLARGSGTRNTVLVGGDDYRDDAADRLADRFDLDAATAGHLASAYGSAAAQVVASEADRVPLVAGHPQVAGEVRYAVEVEGAQRVMDVLARRVRLAFIDPAAATTVVGDVAATMATMLGWSDEERYEEVQAAIRELREMQPHPDATARGAAPGALARARAR